MIGLELATSRQRSFPLQIALAFTLFVTSCGDRKEVEERQFSGIWLYEFEGSTFIEGAVEVPEKAPDYRKVAWLDYDPSRIVESSDYDTYNVEKACYPLHAFAITFVGRKTTDRQGSGHMGLWASEIDVVKMIAAKPVAAPFGYDC